MLKPPKAKNRIRQWFKKEQREENITRGREMLDREAKRLGMDQDFLKAESLLEACRKYTLLTVDDIYAALGEGSITATTILNRIRESRPEKKGSLSEEYQALVGDSRTKPEWGRPTQGIKVRGVDNLLIRLAHCCNPIPGDPIVGYITRGRGVSIHRGDCRNLSFFKDDEENRLVEVAWDSDFDNPFQVKLEIYATDRAGMLSDILAILVEMKISANWINARGRKDTAIIEMVLEMKSKEQLDYIVTKINRVKDVYEVKRTS